MLGDSHAAKGPTKYLLPAIGEQTDQRNVLRVP